MRIIHHAIKHGLKPLVKFYAKNPHHAVAHGAAAVQIGSMVWTQGHHVAKHTVSFMKKAALKGFNLFNG